MSAVRISSSSLRWVYVLSVLLATIFVVSPPGLAQESSQQTMTLTGTVSSSTRNTLVIRTEQGDYRLFTFDRNTTKPATIPVGSQVRVTSLATGDPAVRLARDITITQAAPPPAAPAKPAPGAAPAGAPPAPADNVPAPVRNVERSIEHEARRWHLGIQGGFALDPELVVIGGHMKMGPFFSRNLYFRPSVEFDWGELTNLFGINADLLYNLPISGQGTRWNMYFGVGPAFNFVERSLGGNTGVSFSDFNYDSALNLFLGAQYRNGVFTEIRTSVYASPAPSLRLIVGYTF